MLRIGAVGALVAIWAATGLIKIVSAEFLPTLADKFTDCSVSCNDCHASEKMSDLAFGGLGLPQALPAKGDCPANCKDCLQSSSAPAVELIRVSAPVSPVASYSAPRPVSPVASYSAPRPVLPVASYSAPRPTSAYPPNVNVYPQPFIGQDPPSFDYAPASAYFAPGPTTGIIITSNRPSTPDVTPPSTSGVPISGPATQSSIPPLPVLTAAPLVSSPNAPAPGMVSPAALPQVPPPAPGFLVPSQGSPISQGPAPTSPGPSPGSPGLVPISAGPAPASPEPSPVSPSPDQISPGPAPTSPEPSPVSPGPASISPVPAPMTPAGPLQQPLTAQSATCGAQVTNGGQTTTKQYYNTDTTGRNSVVLTFNANNVPDRFEVVVTSNSQELFDSGYRGTGTPTYTNGCPDDAKAVTGPGAGQSGTIVLPSGTSQVAVIVTSPCSSSAWSFTLTCS